MFEKQCKSGNEVLKASTSRLGDPSGPPEEARQQQDSPIESEPEDSKKEERPETEPLNASHSVAEESMKKQEGDSRAPKPESCESKASKRQKTDS